LRFCAPARRGGETITEFPIPSDSSPFDITADRRPLCHQALQPIGRVTTRASVTYPIPTSGSFPGGITAGPDGNLWFCANASNRIVRLTPAGTFTEYPIPNAFPLGGPSSITTGPDGALWFTETDGNVGGRIRRITTAGQFSPLFSGGNPSQAPQIVCVTCGIRCRFRRVGRVTAG
jgi:virginiamycin B lyase